MIEFNSRLVEVSDTRLEVLEAGAGDMTFICTHPYADLSGPHPGGGMTEACARVGRTFYVCPRGTGASASETRREKLTIRQLATDMEDLRVKLGIQGWVPTGVSTGGMTAIEYGIRYPNSIRGLVLICTAASSSVFGDPDCIYNPGHPLYAQVEAARLKSQETNDGGAHWLRAITYFSLYNKSLTESLLKEHRVSQQRADVIREEVLANWSFAEQLATIKVPTVVIAGRHDVQSPLIASYLMVKDIPDSELAICNYSGHYPYEEEPERFAGIIADFVSRRLGSTRL